MKRWQKLRRQYAKLDVFERVELILSAQEQQDLSEIYILEDTCPSADVIPYIIRMLALRSAAALLAVQMLARTILILRKFERLNQETHDLPLTDPAFLSLFKTQIALWSGFVAWCQDMGHDPYQVLHMAPLGIDHKELAASIVHQQIEICEEFAKHLPPDPDQIHIWRTLFMHSFYH